jgi:release factor glutamine methyltransferase
VYEPDADTHLLIDSVLAAGLPPGARVLDIGTGTGRIALALKNAGAAAVEAIDISRRAALTARLNSLVNRAPVRVRRGDLLGRALGTFDVIVANPPYVPCSTGTPGPHSRARAWDAGREGREVQDRICRDAPQHLSERGSLWLVHSALSRPARTLELLREAGLSAAVVAERDIPFGPVLRSRADWLRDEGLLDDNSVTERIVVIRGDVVAQDASVSDRPADLPLPAGSSGGC